jgi:hypothetical protein
MNVRPQRSGSDGLSMFFLLFILCDAYSASIANLLGLPFKLRTSVVSPSALAVTCITIVYLGVQLALTLSVSH